MSNDDLEMEQWLELATQKELSERDYAELLQQLPKDPEERKAWISELRVAASLKYKSEQLSKSQLKKLVESAQRPTQVSKSRRRDWLAAAAVVMVTFGLGTLVLDRIPRPSNSGNSASEKTIISVFVEDETVEAEISLDLAEFVDPSFESLREAQVEMDIASNTAEVDSDEFGLVELCSYDLETSGAGSFMEMSMDSVKREVLKDSSRSHRTSPLHYTKSAHFEGRHTGENYQSFTNHAFKFTKDDNQSTFSIDVDTASYSNVRRMIMHGQTIPPDAVRVEEMINNFQYDYPLPKDGKPFSVSTSLSQAPWSPERSLLRIGLKGRTDLERPPVNLVFLLDVSGSMQSPDKLPLLKRSFKIMLNALSDQDQISIVAYAGATGVVLDPTPASDRQKIFKAINELQAGGSTAGASGIDLAYTLAQRSKVDGINRVILATDGDFNVGIYDVDELETFIGKKRKSGIELSVLGFGQGNIADDIMESLANRGNGNYSYIDSLNQARKALVEEIDSNLFTIAKDVKIQVEFDVKQVEGFRLIGYENRVMAHRDFDNDQVDAGEIGMGHTVTALYEIVPRKGIEVGDAFGVLRLRHKQPGGQRSQLQQHDFHWGSNKNTSEDDRWAAAIASWGQMLRKLDSTKEMSVAKLIELAESGRGKDQHGYRAETIGLIKTWSQLEDPRPSEGLPRWGEAKR